MAQNKKTTADPDLSNIELALLKSKAILEQQVRELSKLQKCFRNGSSQSYAVAAKWLLIKFLERYKSGMALLYIEDIRLAQKLMSKLVSSSNGTSNFNSVFSAHKQITRVAEALEIVSSSDLNVDLNRSISDVIEVEELEYSEKRRCAAALTKRANRARRALDKQKLMLGSVKKFARFIEPERRDRKASIHW